MSKKRSRPDELIGKLRAPDVLTSRGKKVVDVFENVKGAGGGGRTLMGLRPQDFESDRRGAVELGRSCK